MPSAPLAGLNITLESTQAISNPVQQSAIQDIYPLSPTQEGMLFHSLASPNSGVYVVQVSFLLRGSLDKPAFLVAWRQLIAHHSALRTAFAWENIKAPVQVVGKKAALNWSEPATPAKDEEQDWLARDRHRGFQLNQAPLFRIATFSQGEKQTRIVWTYHHLILDGWSLPILFQDWLQHYATASKGTEPRQPSPQLPYKDYICWLRTQNKDAALNYWSRYLEHFQSTRSITVAQVFKPPAPEPQTKANHPSISISFNLSKSTTEKLNDLARREHITLSTVINGAWAILLSRYTGQDDVIFGLARSGRPPELDQIERRVGMFINTLPLRVRVDTGNTFEWLRTLNRQQKEQQPHEHVSLTEVHQSSQFPRNLPLFETVVVFENYPINEQAPSKTLGLQLSDVKIEEQTNYPLSLFVTGGKRLAGRLYSSPAHYQQPTVRQITTTLEAILTKLAGLETGNLPPLDLFPLPAVHPSSSGEEKPVEALQLVPVTVGHWAAKRPKKAAVVFGETKLTYEQLNTRANALAAKLQPGKAIGILQNRSIEMVVSLLAVLKAGCYYVPLDPSHPPSRRESIIEDAGLDCLLVTEKTAELAKGFPILVVAGEEAHGTNETPESPAFDHTKLAYLIYTSGTTGKPKGVRINHGNLANLLHSMAERIAFTEDNRLLALTTVAFDIAALEIFLPLVTGGTVVIADETTTQDGERILAAIHRHQIDTLQGTPATWQLIHSALGTENWDPTFRILCGGEALPYELAESLLKTGATVWNLYGPTETTIWSGALRLTQEHLADGRVPIGGPLANTSFHVLDSRHRLVPAGVAGELCIGGAGLSPGYHNLPELTDQRFVALQQPAHLVYRTGDQVRKRSDGNIEFIGRMDDQIKLRGYRIELGEIEAALENHPDVKEAVAAVQNGGSTEARLVAVVVFQPGVEPNTHNLRQHLADRIPSYMIPSVFKSLNKLPLTPNRKVDRKAISQLVTSPSLRTGVPPTTGIEQSLARIWQDLLQVDSVSIHDNFFEMGGHSLLILKAQNQVQEQLNIEVALADFFRHPTLYSLAFHIGNHQANSESVQDRGSELRRGRNRLARRRQRAK